MMLILRGLPPDIELPEIRSLVHQRCQLGLVLLDDLTTEAGGTRRVTVAVMDDGDGAALWRALSGERLGVYTIIVEPYKPQPLPNANDAQTGSRCNTQPIPYITHGNYVNGHPSVLGHNCVGPGGNSGRMEAGLAGPGGNSGRMEAGLAGPGGNSGRMEAGLAGPGGSSRFGAGGIGHLEWTGPNSEMNIGGPGEPKRGKCNDGSFKQAGSGMFAGRENTVLGEDSLLNSQVQGGYLGRYGDAGIGNYNPNGAANGCGFGGLSEPELRDDGGEHGGSYGMNTNNPAMYTRRESGVMPTQWQVAAGSNETRRSGEMRNSSLVPQSGQVAPYLMQQHREISGPTSMPQQAVTRASSDVTGIATGPLPLKNTPMNKSWNVVPSRSVKCKRALLAKSGHSEAAAVSGLKSSVAVVLSGITITDGKNSKQNEPAVGKRSSPSGHVQPDGINTKLIPATAIYGCSSENTDTENYTKVPTKEKPKPDTEQVEDATIVEEFRRVEHVTTSPKGNQEQLPISGKTSKKQRRNIARNMSLVNSSESKCGDTTYLQTPLSVSITTEPSVGLTAAQVDLLKKTIEERIFETVLSSSTSPAPVFAPKFLGKPTFRDGALMMRCHDERSLQWLESTVANIPQLEKGISLILVTAKRLIKCALTVPGYKGNIVDLGHALRGQNPHYKVPEWVLYTCNYKKDTDNLFLFLGIPEDTVTKEILPRGQRVRYRLGSIYLKFFSKGGKWVNVPPALPTTKSKVPRAKTVSETDTATEGAHVILDKPPLL